MVLIIWSKLKLIVIPANLVSLIKMAQIFGDELIILKLLTVMIFVQSQRFVPSIETRKESGNNSPKN